MGVIQVSRPFDARAAGWLAGICLASTIGCVLVDFGKISSVLMAAIVASLTVPTFLRRLGGRLAAGDPLYLYFPAIFAIIAFRVINNPGIIGLQFLIALILAFSILLTARSKNVFKRAESSATFAIIAIPVIIVLIWFLLFPGDREKNSVGAFIFYASLLAGLFTFDKRRAFMLYTLVCVTVVILLFDMRSLIIVGGIIAIALYAPIGRRPILMFLATCAGIVLTIFAVTSMQTGALDGYMSAYNAHFDRTLKSGRDIIWPMALDAASKQLTLGNGFELSRFEFRDEQLSAHNQYLEILTQQGMLGVLLCAILLWLIARKGALTIAGDFQMRRFSGVLCAIAYANTFEVQLFQNLFYVGVIQWVLIATTMYCGCNSEIVEPGKSG